MNALAKALMATGLAAVSVGLVGCGSGGAARPAAAGASASPAASSAGLPSSSRFGPAIAALVRQAAQEGSLQLSWSASGFGDNGRDLPKWIADLNRFYGLNLKYSFTPGPSMAQTSGQLVQDSEADSPAPSDAFILGSETLPPVLKAHAARPYHWAALAKDIGVDLPPAAVASGNAAVAFSTEIFDITYNKKAVPADQVPQTLADVLKPQWKGKIASTPYAAGFTDLAGDPSWGPAKTTAFVRRLSRQVGGLVRCGDSAALLSGQYDMVVLDCDVSTAILDQRRGEPIGYVIPRDAPIVDYWYMGVPKTSRHPAAAALLALFMLTKQGQALSWASDGNDLVLLPGSHSAALLPGRPVTGGFVTGDRYKGEYIKLLMAAKH